MEFPRQEYWIGLPFPSPGDLPSPGIEPMSPALQADSLPSETPGKPFDSIPSKPKVQNLDLSKRGLMALQLAPNLVSICVKIPQFLGTPELSVAFWFVPSN